MSIMAALLTFSALISLPLAVAGVISITAFGIVVVLAMFVELLSYCFGETSR